MAEVIHLVSRLRSSMYKSRWAYLEATTAISYGFWNLHPYMGGKLNGFIRLISETGH